MESCKLLQTELKTSYHMFKKFCCHKTFLTLELGQYHSSAFSGSRLLASRPRAPDGSRRRGRGCGRAGGRAGPAPSGLFQPRGVLKMRILCFYLLSGRGHLQPVQPVDPAQVRGRQHLSTRRGHGHDHRGRPPPPSPTPPFTRV